MELVKSTLEQVIGIGVWMVGLAACLGFAYAGIVKIWKVTINAVRVRLRNNRRFMEWLDSKCEREGVMAWQNDM